MKHTPLQRLRHHVSGAIERGEAVAITEQTDNARLIAAAPELLDALQSCLKALHPGAVGLISAHHGKQRGNEVSATVYAARAAIAKATGE